LLSVIKKEYPQTIRIMLTGQADEESILRTVDVVHQFIAKPSDPETLKIILDRACALQDLMKNKELQSLVAGIGNLPSLPDVYCKLQNKMKEPDCSIDDISSIVEQDIAMSAKLLQLVNSSFFGFYNNIDSPSRAVGLLGLDTVKALVLSMGVFSELDIHSMKNFSAKGLWQHSMTVAAYAKRIAQEERGGDKGFIEDVFISGFMHDIGKLVLFSTMREQYLEVLELSQKEGVPIHDSEFTIFNACHGDIGAYLLGLWGLPNHVVETAAFHHRIKQFPTPALCPPLLIHVADAIAHTIQPEKNSVAPQLDTAYLEEIGLNHRVEHWTQLCRQLQF
ncbi:MAG: HDOD domain-containing protein, partial [Eubacteriaceae bacterium]